MGDDVSFCVVLDPRSRKDAATKLRRLPAGSVALEQLGEARLRGVVTRCLAGSASLHRLLSRAEKGAHGGMIRLEGGAAGRGEGAAEEAAAEDAAAEEGAAEGGAGKLSFGLDDVCGESRAAGLYEGDEVSFREATDAATGAVGAADVRLEAQKVNRGFVLSLRDGHGLLRGEAGGAPLSFAASSLPGVRPRDEVWSTSTGGRRHPELIEYLFMNDCATRWSTGGRATQRRAGRRPHSSGGCLQAPSPQP